MHGSQRQRRGGLNSMQSAASEDCLYWQILCVGIVKCSLSFFFLLLRSLVLHA